MSGKKISFGRRPSTQQSAQADDWVASRGQEEEDQPVRMKRLTVDIPESLHRAMKAECAMHGLKIADVVREMLTEKYGS